MKSPENLQVVAIVLRFQDEITSFLITITFNYCVVRHHTTNTYDTDSYVKVNCKVWHIGWMIAISVNA